MAEKQNSPRLDSFVARVVGDPAKPNDTILLTGFLGASSEPGFTRLYMDAALTDYKDVPTDAILHSEPIPAAISSLGGSYLWLRKDAEVLHGKVGTDRQKARFLEGPIMAAIGGSAGAANPMGFQPTLHCPSDAIPCPTDVCPSVGSPCASGSPMHCPPHTPACPISVHCPPSPNCPPPTPGCPTHMATACPICPTHIPIHCPTHIVTPCPICPTQIPLHCPSHQQICHSVNWQQCRVTNMPPHCPLPQDEPGAQPQFATQFCGPLTTNPACNTAEPFCQPTAAPHCLPTSHPICINTTPPICFHTSQPICHPTLICHPTTQPPCHLTVHPICFQTSQPACFVTSQPVCRQTLLSPLCSPTRFCPVNTINCPGQTLGCPINSIACGGPFGGGGGPQGF